MSDSYSQRDLVIAEKIGVLTSSIEAMNLRHSESVETMCKRNLEAHAVVAKMLENYVRENNRDHVAIFKNIDAHKEDMEKHKSLLNKIKGAFAVLTLIWSAILVWLKTDQVPWGK